jgi:predicted dehydrogenase
LYRKPLAILERQSVIQVVGVVDRHRPHAERLLATFPRAIPFDDVATSLERADSEWTLILSPHHLHSTHTLTALRYGSHVLCEKPMATSASECEEMIGAARRAQRTLAVGMIRRFFPAFARLKDLVDQGELGEIQSFQYREGKVFDWEVTTPAGFAKAADGGGGVLLDIGVHALDYLQWLLGPLEPASYADDGLGGAEGNVFMELRSERVNGTVQLSWDSPLRNEFRLAGTRATALLRVDEIDRLAIKHPGGGFEQVDTRVSFAADTRDPSRSQLCPRVYTQAMLCQLIQTIRAIRLNEAPAATGDAGLDALELIEAARTVAEPLDFPWFEPARRGLQQALHWTTK